MVGPASSQVQSQVHAPKPVTLVGSTGVGLPKASSLGAFQKLYWKTMGRHKRTVTERKVEDSMLPRARDESVGVLGKSDCQDTSSNSVVESV